MATAKSFSCNGLGAKAEASHPLVRGRADAASRTGAPRTGRPIAIAAAGVVAFAIAAASYAPLGERPASATGYGIDEVNTSFTMSAR